MKLFLVLLLLVIFSPLPANSELLEWTDDKGVVNFTDNPERVPLKYRGKVRVIEGGKQEPVVSEERKPAISPPAVNTPSVEMYDGKTIDWWKSRYETKKVNVETLRAKLSALKEELAVAWRKKVTLQRQQDRMAYNAKMNESGEIETRIKEAENELAAFMTQAEQAGLPFDWQK